MKENLEKVDLEETNCFKSSNTLLNFGTLLAHSSDVNRFLTKSSKYDNMLSLRSSFSSYDVTSDGEVSHRYTLDGESIM